MPRVKTYRDNNSSRDILIDKLRKKYKMRWVDAYYCCELIDSALDKLLALGINLTIEGIMTIRHDVGKIENPEQLEENRLYLNRVLKGAEKFYHHKHLPIKFIRLKK